MNRIVKWGLLGAVVVLVISFLDKLDVNKVIYTHHPGPCAPVKGLDQGSEDVILISDGRVIVSSGIFFPTATKRNIRGALYLYDLNDPVVPDDGSVPKLPKLEKFRLIGYPDESKFFPAGIHSWGSGNDRVLYAINSYTGNSIDVFKLDVSGLKATYKKTITDPSFNVLNNLYMTGPNTFYTTNVGYFKNQAAQTLEFLLPLPLGSVVYYDGINGTVVASGLRGPNGVTLSSDGSVLYLAQVIAEDVSIYQVLPTHGLKHIGSYPMQTGVDNLYLDEEAGALWVGCHPVMHQVARHMQDPDNFRTPSQVLKMTLDRTGLIVKEVEEVFADDGSTLQGSSVAIYYNQKLLIGTMDHKLMLCNLNKDY